MDTAIAIDTECAGLDLKHGAYPFLVTITNWRLETAHWEWDVNPKTRRPLVIKDDLNEIISLIESADILVFQNAKFDIAALSKVFPPGFKWEWNKVRDTLYSTHLLGSSHPKDLTSAVLNYLGIDISRWEDKLLEAVKVCRSIVTRKGSPIADWKIAKKGMPGLPSIESSTDCVKSDYWLPRAVAKYLLDLDKQSRIAICSLSVDQLDKWLTVLSDYADTDSSSTMALYQHQMKEIETRNLGKIYQQRCKIPKIVYGMESRGVSFCKTRADTLLDKFREQSEECGKVCKEIASKLGYDLVLPDGPINKNLTTFLLEVLKLPVLSKTEKGNPQFDNKTLEKYLEEFPESSSKSKHFFIKNLKDRRSANTAISYLTSYLRFALPDKRYLGHVREDEGWLLVHPSFNPTGANTLRWTSSKPNAQNVGKKDKFNLRYTFGPAPGREWWSLDAKNIELRIPAYESGERNLIDLFEKPDEPPYYGSMHLLNFHTVYSDIWNSELKILTKELGSAGKALAKIGSHCKKKFVASWYQWCKNGGFAVQYGAVEREDKEGTADKAFHKMGAHKLLKERFSKLEKLNNYYIRQAQKTGYVETMPSKTIDPTKGYPVLCTRSKWGNVKPTIPLSYHVQSTAMEWMSQAMIRSQGQLDEWNILAVCNKPYRADRDTYRMVLQVHDELVFDFPAGRGKEPWKTNFPKIRTIARLMEQGGKDIGVPTPVGIEYHAHNWSEGITLR